MKALSPLERLPVEIIQQIFFRCLEINLTQASDAIGKALSDESIYRAVILLAYFDPVPRLPVETEHFKPATFQELDFRERCRIQRQILNSRWFTLKHIKSAIPTLSRLAMVQQWHFERKLERNEYLDPPAVPFGQLPIQAAKRSLAHVAPLPDLADADAMKKHFAATLGSYRVHAALADAEDGAQSTNQGLPGKPEDGCHGKDGDNDDDTYLPFISYWACKRIGSVFDTPQDFDEVDTSIPSIVKSVKGVASVLGVRYIPSWLLRGPWSGPDVEERIELLKLLRQALQDVLDYRILDISADALFEGIKVAISTHDPAVPTSVSPLAVLLELWWYVFATKRDYDRMEVLPITSKLPLELFHYAATDRRMDDDNDNDNDNDSQILISRDAAMELLLQVSVQSIPPNDAILTSWGLRTKSLGNRVGDWLLNYMTHLDQDIFYTCPASQFSPKTDPGSSDVFPRDRFITQLGYLESPSGVPYPRYLRVFDSAAEAAANAS